MSRHHLMPALAFASIILAPGELPAATGGDAVIRPESQKQLIDRFFYDFKSPNGAYRVASNHATYNATNLFTKDGLNGIRTPIYGTRTNPNNGDAGKPAHPEPGVVIGAYYADEVSGLKKALAVNPDLVIFASKKLNGDGSFPTWVLSTDKNGDDGGKKNKSGPPSDPKGVFTLTRKASEFMEANREKPFFCYLTHYAIHVPQQARPETLAKFQAKASAAKHGDPMYAACTYDLDAGVGLLLEKIKELGLDDNTLVVFTSDNGGTPSRLTSRMVAASTPS